MTENQCLSTIFGHKIAQKLFTPKSIKLDNPYYKNISTIVYNELYILVQDKQRLSTDDITHERMLHEVADKVTVWIASILEDSSEKLLEEDLKVKKMRDRTSATDAELITLIGTMVCMEAELEEEEGPVLDLLDDLVDNVVDSFKKDSESSFSQSSSYDVAQEYNEKDKIGILTPDYISAASQSDEDTESEALPIPGTLDDIYEIRESKSEYSVNKYLKEKINEIIASNAFGTPSIDEERSKSGISAEAAKSHSDVDNYDTIFKDQTPSFTDSFASISSLKSKGDENFETGDNIEPVVNENQGNSNVSDALAILDEESEERNKKVQFSHDDLGALIEMDQHGSISRKQELNSITSENVPAHTMKEITYAPPNEHILSEADDVWPDNISPLAIKPSASVSKSITSMGRILESDEKNIPTPEEQSQDLSPQPPESAELQYMGKKEDIMPQAPLPPETTELLDFETRDTLDTNYENNASDALHPNLYDGSNQNELTDLSYINGPKTEFQEILSSENVGDHELNAVMDELVSSNREQPFFQETDKKSVGSLGHSLDLDFDFDLLKNDPDDDKESTLKPDIRGKKDSSQQSLVSLVAGELKKYSDTLQGIISDREQAYPDSSLKEQSPQFERSKSFENIKSSPTSSKTHQTPDLLKNDPDNDKESTLKPDIRGKKDSSQQSLVSLVAGELKKYSDTLQGIISDREQAYPDSSLKVQSPQFERSKSVENIKSSPTSSKTHQRRLSADVRHTKKFDYRVHQKTAPAWIRRGQGEPSGGRHKRCSCRTDVPMTNIVETPGEKWRCPDPPGAKTMEQREREIQKWCKDFDDILLNLSKWKNWLDYITGYINNLKQEAENNKLIKPDCKMNPAANVSKCSKSVNKDLWTKLNQRAKEGLKLYKLDETIKFKISRSPVPVKYCVKCGKRQIKRFSRSPVRK